MSSPKPEEFNWSLDDQITIAKWRRGVFIFYGCVFLALLATWGTSRVGNVGLEGARSTADLTVRLPNESP